MYSEWAQDEICIEELEVFAHHGVYPEETIHSLLTRRTAVLRI